MLVVVSSALATVPSAQAASDHSFLIPSETGPVHYPACSGPLTWSLHTPGITDSGSTPVAEHRMWQQAFQQLDDATDYTFVQLPDDSAATISIHYTDRPADLDLPITRLAPGTAGLGGIVDLAWSGTHWIAKGSVVALKPTELRRWNHISGLRSWVARHELAHALGLGHQDDPGSTMARKFSRPLSQPTYQDKDFEQLNTLARASCPKPLP